MAIVCSNCEAAPGAGAVAGTACTACGERLIAVDTGDDLVGMNIDGRFHVIAPLGHGGMGVVYRAKQLSIGRDVALKVLDRRIEKDVASVKRFFREAKLASTLAHPNTVPIIDFGQNQDGRLFLAMELIKGKTLLDEMNAVGPLPLARLIAIGVQLCDALEVAHDLHIVHRDLKLENVMLLDGKRDHVKILDFGLARSLVDPTTAMTATGLISGTPRYMAPEVGLDAAAPDPSQDMYSIGVMLAELSIGHALWNAATIEVLFTKKLDTDEAIAEVPAVLQPLIRSLVSNEPGRRPTATQTRQLLRDLDSAKPALAIELDPPSVLGGAKHARAQSPVALEPTADIQVEVVDPFAKLELVDVDGRDEAPRPAPTPAPMVQHDGPLGALDERFTAPPEAGAPTLEIDRAYIAERSIKLAARPAPVTVVKKSNRAGLVVSLLLIALVGAGAYVAYTYKRDHDRKLPGGGVTIWIESTVPRAVRIDGDKAGNTPLHISRASGTKPILIEADGVDAKQVVPDRDQTVRLGP